MTHPTQTFTVVDPRTFDGDPYEVAERAAQQAAAIARILAGSISTASIMARNAEMSRSEDTKSEMEPQAWEDSVYGRKFARAEADAKQVERTLNTLAVAAGFNPKAKVKA